MIQTKLQFQAILDQVFPEYRGVFGDLYSVVSLLTLKDFPSSEDILGASEETLSNRINVLCKSRSIRWANEKALQLKEAAARNPFEKTLYQSYKLSLGMYINIILQYKEHLSTLELEIDALAKEVEEYTIIKSIPGIGEKIAATIISEIGEIDRFTDPKKLVASLELTLVYSNLVSLRPPRIGLRNEDRAGFVKPYIWQFDAPYAIVVNRKPLMTSFPATNECVSFTTRNVKKESLLK